MLPAAVVDCELIIVVLLLQFKRSQELHKDMKPFAFFDGPPFATGLPHYGHLLAGTIKASTIRPNVISLIADVCFLTHFLSHGKCDTIGYCHSLCPQHRPQR